MAPTMGTDCPPIVEVNSVGVAPKSESPALEFGCVCQESCTAKVTGSRRIMASWYGSGCGHVPSPLPVSTKSSPVESSMVGELHIVAPVQPLGTATNVAWVAPV